MTTTAGEPAAASRAASRSSVNSSDRPMNSGLTRPVVMGIAGHNALLVPTSRARLGQGGHSAPERRTGRAGSKKVSAMSSLPGRRVRDAVHGQSSFTVVASA